MLADGGGNNEDPSVRFTVAQIVSKAFMVAAMVAFAAFHFIRDPDHDNYAGWKVWVELWDLVQDPLGMDEPLGWVAVASFLTTALLIMVSPFLGWVWVKSRMAWLPAVISSGFAAAGFIVAMVIGRATGGHGLGWGMYLLMAAPVLNFIGLLFARVSAPQPDKSQMGYPSPGNIPDS